MIPIKITFNHTDNLPHSVHGVRNEDGVLELIAPGFTIKSVGKFVIGYYREPKTELNKFQAVEIAKTAMDTGKYQDVYVVRNNGIDAHTIIYSNGRWANKITDIHYMDGESSS